MLFFVSQTHTHLVALQPKPLIEPSRRSCHLFDLPAAAKSRPLASYRHPFLGGVTKTGGLRAVSPNSNNLVLVSRIDDHSPRRYKKLPVQSAVLLLPSAVHVFDDLVQ